MNEMTTFSIDRGALKISSRGQEERRIEVVDGMKIQRILPRGNHALLLLEPQKRWGTFQNLVKIDDRGEVVWRAEASGAASQPNEYTSITIGDDGAILASTWGGIRVALDWNTGAIVSEKFVK